METPHVRSLDQADTSHETPGARIDLIELGGLAFDRATFEPGWRWSEVAGSASCRERHLGYLVVSGHMRFRMDDGSEVEAHAGDVYLIPPGHDAWSATNPASPSTSIPSNHPAAKTEAEARLPSDEDVDSAQQFARVGAPIPDRVGRRRQTGQGRTVWIGRTIAGSSYCTNGQTLSRG